MAHEALDAASEDLHPLNSGPPVRVAEGLTIVPDRGHGEKTDASSTLTHPLTECAGQPSVTPRDTGRRDPIVDRPRRL